MAAKITRRDVAQLAGVSETTVSVVLNDNRNISIAEETRKRVLKAARQLGYAPNYAARAMASRQAGTIGILSPWTADVWFFAQMLDGIREAAAERGCGVLLCGKLEEEKAAADAVRAFREKRVDGIVYLPPSSQELPALQQLLGEKIPIVLCNGWAEDLDSVMIDYAEGIAQAVEKQKKAGFSRFLYVLPDQEKQLCAGDRERLAGFRRGLPAELAKTAVFHAGRTPLENIEAAKRLLAKLEFPCAVVCCYWNITYFVQEAARAMGLTLGRDITVISGDRPDFTQALYPPINGIELPFSEVGRRAAACLLDRVADPNKKRTHMKIHLGQEESSC